MIKIIISIIVLVLCSFFVVAQLNQPINKPLNIDTNTEQTELIFNKMEQDNRNIEKYITKELNDQRTIFFTEMDDRGKYYEELFNDMVRTAIWKLGLLFGGIIFFSTSFNMILRLKLEKRRFNKLKIAVKDSVKKDLNLYQKPKGNFQQQDTFINDKNARVDTYNIPPPPAPISATPELKKSRRERKLEKKEQIFSEQLEKVRQQKAILNMVSQPKERGLPVSPISQSKQESDFEYNFEVNYNE